MCDAGDQAHPVNGAIRSDEEFNGHGLQVIFRKPAETSSRFSESFKPDKPTVVEPKPVKNLVFCGRYVTKVELTCPFTVSKHFVRPQMSADSKFRASTARIMRTLFNVYELRKILFLITPIGRTSNSKNKFNIHGYQIEGQRHIGVTNLTEDESAVIERDQGIAKYSLIISSGYIELPDAFMKTSVKDLIFEMLKNESSTTIQTEYGNKMLTLQYKHVDFQETDQTTSNLATRNPPKIRYRAKEPLELGPLPKLNLHNVLSNTKYFSMCSMSKLFNYKECLENEELKVDRKKTYTCFYGFESDQPNPIMDTTQNDEQGNRENVENINKNPAKTFISLPEVSMPDKPNEVDLKISRNLVFPGRYVTKVEQAYPFSVSKHFVRPQMSGDFKLRANTARIMRTLFNVYELSNILFLITPVERESSSNDKFNIHGYHIKGEMHIGVTTLTENERARIERDQHKGMYSLINCSGHILLKDAYTNSKVKDLIFNMVKCKSSTHEHVHYDGNILFFEYKHVNFVQVNQAMVQKREKIPCRGNKSQDLQENLVNTMCPPSDDFNQKDKLYKRSLTLQIPTKMYNLTPLNDKVIKTSTCQRKVLDEAAQDKLKKTSSCRNDEARTPNNRKRSVTENSKKKSNTGTATTSGIGKHSIRTLAGSSKQVQSGSSDVNSMRQVNCVIKTSKKNNGRKLSKIEEKSKFNDGFQALIKPHALRDSDGIIHDPDDLAMLALIDSDTMLDTNSKQFERLMRPLEVPENVSKKARMQLVTKLCTMGEKHTFYSIWKLLKKINSRPVPRRKHLVIVFGLLDRLEVKLYVRPECCLPGFSPTNRSRSRIECYMFDDRKDFLFSLGILQVQLKVMTELLPGIVANLRYVDDAFELANFPTQITTYIRAHTRATFSNLLAEYCYDIVQPKSALMTVTNVPADDDNISGETRTPKE